MTDLRHMIQWCDHQLKREVEEAMKDRGDPRATRDERIQRAADLAVIGQRLEQMAKSGGGE